MVNRLMLKVAHSLKVTSSYVKVFSHVVYTRLVHLSTSDCISLCKTGSINFDVHTLTNLPKY